MKNKKLPVASICFYVASVIFLLIGAFYIFYTYNLVAVAKLSGTAPAVEDILNVAFNAVAPFFAYAIGCYGIGYIIAKLAVLTNALTSCMDETVSVEDEEDDIVEELIATQEVTEESKPQETKEESKPQETKEETTTQEA